MVLKSAIRNPQSKIVILGPAVVAAALPGRALAMHIADGILPASWAGLWFLLALPFLFFGLRALKSRSGRDPQFKPLVALVGAAVFIISCLPIPVPTAGTCAHMGGTGLAALLIGPNLTVLITSVALVLQALFLAHGGLTSLGADIVSMGVAGAFTGYGVFVFCLRLRLPWWAAPFLAGLLSDWATYGVTSFQLASALAQDGAFMKMFTAISLAFVPTQVPLGIFEGLISAGAYRFIRMRRPEVLAALRGRNG